MAMNDERLESFLQIEVIAILSFTAVLGLIYCVFGSRFFRILITFTAFIAGLLLAYKIAGVYFSTFAAKAAISAAGGLVLALIFNILHHVGRFLAGVAAAAFAGLVIFYIFQISRISYAWDALLLLCLIAGICASNKKVCLRVATALIGAFLVSLVLLYFIHGINPMDFSSIKAAKKAVQLLLVSYPYYIAGSVLLLTLAGVFFQFWQSLRFIPNFQNDKRKAPANMLLLPPSPESSRRGMTVSENGNYTGNDVGIQ